MRRLDWRPGRLCAILAALCVTAAAVTTSAQASFTPAPGSPLAVGAQPYAALAQDLNGDGRVDVAAMNGTSSDLSVFLRTPAGGFAAASGSPFATGSGPSEMTVADFNADGRPDFAVSNYVAGTVSVLLGQPGGGWAQEAGGAVSAPYAGAVAVTDLNADSRPDLLVPDYNSGGVSVLLRLDSGGFQLDDKPATGTNPRDLAVADFNADGRPDMAVTNIGDGTVTVLLGLPGGGFAAESGSPIAVGSNPAGIVARDLNGDGRPDLAVTNHASNNVSVLLRQAGGGFAPDAGSPLAVPAGPSGIASADIDGNGRPDLVVASDQANVLSVLLNAAPAPGLPEPAAAGGSSPTAISVVPHSPPAVVGIPARGLEMAGAGGKVSPTLERALTKADLEANLRSATASSRVSEQASQKPATPDPAIQQRLGSLAYGIPVTVRGNAGEVAAVAGALAITSRTETGTQVTLVQLPPVAAQLTGPKTVVRLPVDQKAAAELQRKGVAEAAVTVAAQEVNVAKDQVDSLSEMGQMESLRLQMAMDRMSKMMSTLSNLLKQVSDTSSTITGNLKRPTGSPAGTEASLRRRAGAAAKAANAAGHEAATLLAPVLRAHTTAPPRATFALKPCPKRCTYPRFGR